MAGYQPLYIKAYETGLVQSRQEFILPEDAFPVLENAFVWRERIKRKQGCQLLGRLQRNITITPPNNTNSLLQGLEATATLVPGSLNIIGSGGVLWTDPDANGVLVPGVAAPNGTVNYSTGVITGPTPANTGTFSYYPNLPVMGLRTKELNENNNEELVAFDTTYAYRYVNGFQEYLPGTTWQGTDSEFFWTTNYWVDKDNNKVLWATNFNFTGILLTSDPIRYTNGVIGTSWVTFDPIVNGTIRLQQCLALLPFRGRLVAFNTYEGDALNTGTQYSNRIRWSAIGNPFTEVSAIVTTVNSDAWKDTIRGQGGYLDIPTTEAIVSVGFVRDNLVIYCERSTWQLRYTGRSIAPFQIEKVNSELGAEGTFSAVQFDTSLVGIGDKGVVECDSFKSERIDIKIPDLVFEFNNENDGPERVYGIRDFFQRLAFWTYPFVPDNGVSNKFPNRRLVYNYENDSWAIFTDSFTCFGNYQPQVNRTWANTPYTWATQRYPWTNQPSRFPSIIGGNQQGFVEFLDIQSTNDVSLSIYNITGNNTNPTIIQSIDHNLEDGYVIEISGIPTGKPFDNLNGHVFGITIVDKDNFRLWIYNTASGQFNTPQTDASGQDYIGGGLIAIRDNFSVISKKFNFLDDGQNIQMGFIDVLMDSTESGAISLNVYLDYNESEPINILPQNVNNSTLQSDTFFNSVVPTTLQNPNGLVGSKYWQRVFCPVRGAFITLEWTLSNAQMVGDEQSSDVQIDAQILWLRKAGRQLPAV